MILQKLFIYFLCISIVAYVYVYKIPIFCSECESPTGFSKNIFRCVISEKKLCSIHHELNDARKSTIAFIKWVGKNLIKNIPDALMKELSKIWKDMKNIGEKITEIVSKVGTIIKKIMDDFIEKIKKFFEDIISFINNIITKIKNGIIETYNKAYDAIKGIYEKVANTIEKFITEVKNQIYDSIIKPLEVIGNIIAQMMIRLKAIFVSLVDKIMAPFKRVFELLGPLLSGVYNEVRNAITRAFEPLIKPFKDIANKLTDALNKVKETIKKAVEVLEKFITENFNKIKEFIKDNLKKVTDFIKSIYKKIEKVITNELNYIYDLITGLKDKIVNSFKDAFYKFKGEIMKIIKPIDDVLKMILKNIENIYKKFISILNDIYSSVKDQWTKVYNLISERIFTVIYIYYINFIDFILPMDISKTLKVNFVNSMIVIGILGFLNFYYTRVSGVITKTLDGVVTIMGDAYSIVDMGMMGIDILNSIFYNILKTLPTLGYAMDNLGYLSPTKLIRLIMNNVIGLFEFIAGSISDTFSIFPTLSLFITILLISIIYGIHTYLTNYKMKRRDIKVGMENFELPPTEPTFTFPDRSEIDTKLKEIQDFKLNENINVEFASAFDENDKKTPNTKPCSNWGSGFTEDDNKNCIEKEKDKDGNITQTIIQTIKAIDRLECPPSNFDDYIILQNGMCYKPIKTFEPVPSISSLVIESEPALVGTVPRLLTTGENGTEAPFIGGKIKWNSNNKCITVNDDPENSNSPMGNKYIIKDCTDDAKESKKQAFRFEDRLLKTTGDLCVDVPYGNDANGTVVTTNICEKGNQSQKFFYENGMIKWRNSGKCLDVTSGDETKGISINTCDSNNVNQKFTSFAPNPPIVNVPGKKIKWFKDPSKCLNITDRGGGITSINIQSCDSNYGNTTQGFKFEEANIYSDYGNDQCVNAPGDADGTPIKPETCDNSNNELFTYDDGLIRWSNSGKCLAVYDGVNQLKKGRINDTPIVVWPCKAKDPNQRFIVEGKTPPSVPPPGKQIRWKHNTNKCIDIDGNNEVDGTKIQIWDCNTGDAQKFTFDKGLLRTSAGDQCVSVPGGRDNDNTPTKTWECNEYDNNEKFLYDNETGLVRWSNSGKCLAVYGGVGSGGSNGTEVVIHTCDEYDPNQIFNFGDNVAKGKDPGKQIEWKGKRRCIAVLGGNTANDTLAELHGCEDGNHQKFVYQDNTLRWGGTTQCLAVPGGSDANGTPMRTWRCNKNDNNQKFIIDGDQIKWSNSGKCLDIPNSTMRNTQIEIHNCHGGDNQKFAFSETPLVVPPRIPGKPIKWYADQGKCIDVSGGGANKGNKIQIWGCNESLPQNFTFEDGLIRVDGGDQCISVPGGNDKDGTKVVTWDCDNNDNNEKFSYTDKGLLKWRDTGKCLAVRNGENYDGNELVIWTCDAYDSNQRFFPVGKQAPPEIDPGKNIRWKSGSDKCIDIDGGKREDNTKVQIWGCDQNSNNQKLKFEDGLLRWGGTSYCLGVPNGNDKDDTPVYTYKCNTNDNNQKFWYDSTNQRIPWSNSGKCLDVSNGVGSGGNNGTKIAINSCQDNNANQKFEIV